MADEETTASEPVLTSEMQYYIDIADAATAEYTNVTEDTAFDPTTDLTTYDPKYKNRINQPSITTGKKTSIAMDVDIYENQVFQTWLIKHEDDINVPTSVVRVWMNRPATAPATGYEAKMARFNMTESPIDGPAGEPLKATGTLNMTDDGWTKGTFDPTTKTFTPIEG